MTPYRVLAVDSSDPDVIWILSSQLSINQTTQERNVFILRKFIPGISQDQLSIPGMGLTPAESKAIAHRQSNKHNSEILEQYRLIKLINNRYTLHRIFRDADWNQYSIPLGIQEYTQGDCLPLALEDYCLRNNMKIVQKL